MSVDEALEWYLVWAETLADMPTYHGMACPAFDRASLLTDAASISLDLAVAEASIERIRRGVAWG